MRVGAVQMKARLGDVEGNLRRAEGLLDEAFSRGCEMVILPEFFTSAMAFHPSMLSAALPFDGPALEMMRGAARRHDGGAGEDEGSAQPMARGQDMPRKAALELAHCVGG